MVSVTSAEHVHIILDTPTMDVPFESYCKIIAHTISDLDNDIITFELGMPYWIIQDFNTHKVEIERNSASTRAVPTSIMMDMVTNHPSMPFEWRYNQSGMQGSDLMTDADEAYAIKQWLLARNAMLHFVQKLQKLPSGRATDKQRVNMLMMQWLGTVVVCTMTGGGHIGMNNFFGLRDNAAARPEIQQIAHMMHEQYHASTPKYTEWHLPYINKTEVNPYSGITFEQLAIISSARCGRVTHYKQGQEYDLQKEVERGMSFFENGHFSPLRHAAQAGDDKWYGNMYGWNPISKIISKGQDYVSECCALHDTVANGDILVGPTSK